MALRILITGVNGFIGQKLTRVLCAQGHSVLGVSLEQQAKHPNLGLEYRCLDITDHASAETLLETEHLDAVIHLAALVHVRDAALGFADYSRVNFRASEAIFRAAACNHVGRVVFASTVEVYGPPPLGGAIDEDTPCRPDSDYARAKLLAEESLRSVAERAPMAYAILRFAPVYSSEFRVNLDKRLYLRSPSLGYTLGGGNYLLSMCSVTNIQAWVLRWLELPQPASGTYNLADEHNLTARQILRLERDAGRARLVLRLPTVPCLAALAAREAVMSAAGLDVGMFTAANLRKLTRSTLWDTRRARDVVGSLPGDIARDLYPSPACPNRGSE